MQLNRTKAKRFLKTKNFTPTEINDWLNLHHRETFATQWVQNSAQQPWTPRDYQRESLESYATRKVHCDGRDVGKTSEIEIAALWAAAACPHSEMLIATQCENHLFPLMNRVVRAFDRIPEFKAAIVELKRTPSWFIRFDNGFVLWGRISGPRGINFQGLHVDWQLVDEAQEMTEAAWGELYQALNAGGRRWIYGVPNGLRNTFFRMTQDPNAQQFNWPSTLNPDYTRAKDMELARLYGGFNTPGYIHRVLGKHGAPEFAVFSLDDYLACVDQSLDFINDELQDDVPFEAPTNVPKADYYLGCDLGYAHDPSEFVIYKVDGPDLINVHRIQLRGVNYAHQQDIIHELDRAYGFRMIGIDNGNAGRAVAHHLKNNGVEWCDRIQAYEFGATIELEPFPDGQPQRTPIKPFMTELIQRRLHERTLVLPNLPERENQYANHTYHYGYQARIVYEKGNDHLIDADRCAILAHYQDTQQPIQPHHGFNLALF